MRIAKNLGEDMTTWFKVFTLFFVLLLSYGCVATGSQKINAAGRTAGIEAGKATQAEVSALLGFPAIVTYGEKGQETWNYYYVTEYPTATDFIPVVNGVVAGFQQNTKVLTLTFDRQGVARNLQRSEATGNPEVYPY
ncbi:MAG: outer membrane protein assembly factor BamE [Deltaproteobacteria bacterium]|nr:outer membrane protein assembly factor BamE [Deltaproteobacteria bacterium]